jgi:diguanylate cyclase (GGDEF)-like protein
MTIGYPLPTTQAIDDLLQQAHNLRLDNTRLALQISQQAGTLALQIDYQKGLAYCLYLNCLCHFILADENSLLEKAFQALSLFEGLQDQHGAAKAHNLLALIYERQDQLEKAVDAYRMCLIIRRNLGDRAGQSAVLNNIALVHRSQENDAQALEYLFEAYKLAEASEDPETQAYALANIAEVYQDTGEYTRAMSYAQRALQLNIQVNDRALESTLLTLIGKLSYQFGQHDEAVAYLRRSLNVSQETGNRNDEGDALLALGVLYQDLSQYETAGTTLDLALQVMRQLGSRRDEAEVLCALGKTSLQQGDHGAALDFSAQALQAATEAQAASLVCESLLLLSQAHEAQGDYRQALEHFQAHHQASSDITGRGALHQVQELTAEWENHHTLDATQYGAGNIRELSSALQALQEADEQKALLIRRLTHQAELLEQLAREDGLTGLSNRRWLDLKLAHEIERANRFGHALSVALIDLDNFKWVNDTISHQVGDAVLVQVSNLMRENFRTVDIIGRYGGEEFMAILVETVLENAEIVCERLRLRVAEHNWQQLHPQLALVTLSIGITSYRLNLGPEVETPKQLTERADQQLYRAKRQGKNQVCGCE